MEAVKIERLRHRIKNIRIYHPRDSGFIAYSKISTLESGFKKLQIRMADSPDTCEFNWYVHWILTQETNEISNKYILTRNTNTQSQMSLNAYYYSFKIFPQFWLAKSTRLIHHKQFSQSFRRLSHR